jgi:hypothetical protein
LVRERTNAEGEKKVLGFPVGPGVLVVGFPTGRGALASRPPLVKDVTNLKREKKVLGFPAGPNMLLSTLGLAERHPRRSLKSIRFRLIASQIKGGNLATFSSAQLNAILFDVFITACKSAGDIPRSLAGRCESRLPMEPG